jgi:alpha-tubulin suppressor-like RCC1 family protein
LTRLGVGAQHACAVVSGGLVKCWGSNQYGQLGDNAAEGFTATPQTVVNLKGVTSVSAGYYHSCALLSNGTVKCWGFNADGELGDGDTTDKPTPQTVVGLTGVVALTTEGTAGHTCALLKGGTMECWGSNVNGKLGDGTTVDRTTPVPVLGVTGVVAVATGLDHTCAIVAGGHVECWGYNALGELGTGDTAPRSGPVAVVGLSGATAIAAGSYHTCAVVTGGAVKCWGGESLGSSTTFNSSVPVDAEGVSGASVIGAGLDHTCASGPTVTQCWGTGGSGQLGNGGEVSSRTPVTAIGVGPLTVVGGGDETTCGLLPSGLVKCWGVNPLGQAGDPSYIVEEFTPFTVSGIP